MRGFRFSTPRTIISPAVSGGMVRTESKNLRCFAASSSDTLFGMRAFFAIDVATPPGRLKSIAMPDPPQPTTGAHGGLRRVDVVQEPHRPGRLNLPYELGPRDQIVTINPSSALS
jgi:hypothetical protein